MSKLAGKTTADEASHVSLSERAEAIAAAWAEARQVYPLYCYLATHFHLAVPPVHENSLPAACPASDVFEKVILWLDQMDSRIRTNQLRQLLHSIKDLKPESLRALILRLLRRTEKTPTDRDNVDLLLATYFALCAPEDLYSCEITLGDVAQVLQSVLIDADATELEWCEPLNHVLDAIKQCQGLGDLFGARLLEKGRELKDAAGFMFYDPAALVAFTRFNFLARRSFFRLLHADLRAIREGLTELERRGIFAVDCRSVGLGMQESTSHLREISLAWRQPISKDYADESANRTFEQLLSIRAAVERAQGIAPHELKIPQIGSSKSVQKKEAAPAPKLTSPPNISQKTREGRLVSPPSPAVEHKTPLNQPSASSRQGAPLQRSVDNSVKTSDSATIKVNAPQPPAMPAEKVAADTKPAPTLERNQNSQSTSGAAGRDVLTPALEKCLENIWEQLIEAPPARGRSMSTVTLGNARILLSAWEVNAFVSEGGQLSEDLRRAVAARALIVLAREDQKASGNRGNLDDVIALGREEMKYLQGRVDQAQRTKDTEAAVNLGISARRLLSAVEEAQK
ncbi:MAG TPA: hypothetical protein VKS20_00530 [Candidatus Acidoferrales bacterium]|nr:hypothetical protein [Candidatus Acidoferrales bacterium]